MGNNMNMSNIESIAQKIIAQAGANPELLRSVAELLEAVEGAEKVTTAKQEPGMYVYCAEMVVAETGEIHYHPIVGDGYRPAMTVEENKMLASKNIVELQHGNAESRAASIRSMGVNTCIIFVPEETYKVLENALNTLLQGVMDLVTKGIEKEMEANGYYAQARAMLTKNRIGGYSEREITEAMLLDRVLPEIFRNIQIAGEGLTTTMEVVSPDPEVYNTHSNSNNDDECTGDECTGDCAYCDKEYCEYREEEYYEDAEEEEAYNEGYDAGFQAGLEEARKRI